MNNNQYEKYEQSFIKIKEIIADLNDCLSSQEFYSIANKFNVDVISLIWIYISFFRDNEMCQNIVMDVLSQDTITHVPVREMLFVFGKDVVVNGYKNGTTPQLKSYNNVRMNEALRDYDIQDTPMATTLYGVSDLGGFFAIKIVRLFSGPHKYQSRYNEYVLFSSVEELSQFCETHNLSAQSFMGEQQIEDVRQKLNEDYYSNFYDYTETVYQQFEKLGDGIYDITLEQYSAFVSYFRLKNQDGFSVNLKQKYLVAMKLLKKSGYYVFIGLDKKNTSYLMYGGRATKIKYDVTYCYDNMLKNIDSLNEFYIKYRYIMQLVSKYIKSKGGDGYIHGCIVDIDGIRHVYVNFNDMTLTYYIARNKKDKYVWNDAVSSGYLVDLQDIVLRLEKKNVLNNVLTVTKTGSIQKSNIEYCSDTDIYSVSDKIKQLINIYDTHIISVESMLR